MADRLSAIDQPTLERLVTGLREAERLWTPAGFPELARRFGWSIRLSSPAGVLADVPWPVRDGAVRAYFDGEGIRDVTVSLAETGGRPDAPAAFLLDVFALAVWTVTAVFGTPTSRSPGAEPEARWRGPEHTVRVTHVGTGVNLVLAANGFLEDWDAVGEEDGE
ncbi:DUF6301 family protein [Actinoplanes flavus]|uniref:SUKH-3 immunity protein n=1 Tax=Actinoplanes flavus TaxID=2820290 RepID=A0ABS3UXC3_9ACTN|nr:DUF6301 family protein [Actinoplanes flavus]MBO3743212.1 hypothetical protein [Actinoplanes flavus]